MRAGAARGQQPGSGRGMLAPRKVLHSTPRYVLDAAFDLAALAPTDLLVDVGCGDGRALLAAAERGCRCVGWEINPERSAAAAAAVAESGVGERVAVHTGNILSAAAPELWDLFDSLMRRGSGAAGESGLVIMLYLTEYGVRKLLPLVAAAAAARPARLGPVRVLSYMYPFPSGPSTPAVTKHRCVDPDNPDRCFPLFYYVFSEQKEPALTPALGSQPCEVLAAALCAALLATVLRHKR